MNFEDLDKDTQGIIDAMCHNTGKSREQAILALVEFGMLAMEAAIASNFFLYNKQKKIMQVVYNIVNADEDLKKTAEGYYACWTPDI